MITAKYQLSWVTQNLAEEEEKKKELATVSVNIHICPRQGTVDDAKTLGSSNIQGLISGPLAQDNDWQGDAVFV